MKITAIESVFLRVSDLDRAAHFYGEILGLRSGHRTDSAAEFWLGEDRIGILHADPAGGDPGGGGPLVFLQVEDIDGAVAELRQEAVPLVGKISLMDDLDGSQIRVATFQDPDGNTLHLVEKVDRSGDY